MRNFFVLTFILIYSLSKAETPIVEWSKCIGGPEIESAQSITHDNKNNVYVTGYFTGTTITFGTFILNNNNFGGKHMFIAKYDSIGNVLWAKSTTDNDAGYGLSVAVDPTGNVFVGGTFSSSSITFGSQSLINYAGMGMGTAFLVKYDSAGNAIWAKTSSNTYSSNAVYSVCTDNSGNVYTTGHFQDNNITFGSNTLTNSYSPNQDIFITKYDSLGNVLWAKGFGGNGHDVGTSISVDANNNVLLTGNFASTSIVFGTKTLTNTNSSNRDLYIAKLNSNGTVQWAKSAGSSGDDYVSSITVDKTGNAYIGGYFNNNSISFGSISLTNSNSIYSDQFLAKYDGTGAIIWAKNAKTSSNNNAVNSVYADNNGYIYTTGYFDSPSMKLDTILLNNLGAENIYIAKYNEIGNIIWAKSYGGTKTDFGKSVTSDTNGNVYFTGQFTSPNLKFDALNLSNIGLNDLFITKITLANTIDSIIVNYCPEETSLIMNAPSGYTSYNWTNSIGIIVSTSQTCNITNPTEGSVYFCKKTSSSGEIKTSKHTLKKYSTPTITIAGKLSYCRGFQTKLKVSGATKYLWSNGSKSDSILIGTDSNLWVIGYSSNGCKSDTIFRTIKQEPDWTLNIVGNSIFCDGKSVTLTASGAATYLWNNGDKTNTITATKAGSYTVIGTNNSGCSQSKTIDVVVSELPSSNFDLSTNSLDKRHNQLTCKTAEQIGIQFNWDMGDGTSETGSNIEHSYSISNSKLEYTITLTATNNYGCSSSTFKTIDVVPFIPNVFTPNGDGVNELFMSNVELEIFDRYGIRLYKGTTGWDGKYKGQLVDSDTYFYLIKYTNKTLKGSVELVK